MRRGRGVEGTFFLTSRVLNGDEETSGEHDLLPSLAEMEDVDAVSTTLPAVISHLEVLVLGTEVTLSSEHRLDV